MIDSLIERIRNRPNDAPMPTEHLLDEAADALANAESEIRRRLLTDMVHLMQSCIEQWQTPVRKIREYARERGIEIGE